MARRIKYKTGDLFLLPLDDTLNGVGRILMIDQATVFIELYQMKPIKDFSEFDKLRTNMSKPLAMLWCYNTRLRNGDWFIFDNIPITKEIEMPYFWYFDSGYQKYYIQKGSNDALYGIGECIEINEEDIKNYDSLGIGDTIYEKNLYIQRLKELELY